MQHISPESENRTCVVFGAGALGLGFLGPELSPTYRMAYVDIPQKGDFLDYLSVEGKYAFNETGPSARAIEVGGVRGISSDRTTPVEQALDGAELVFTAVGEPNLSKVAPVIARAVTRRTRECPLRVLCCENGVEIARKFTDLIGTHLPHGIGGRAVVADTVMGRMCKVVQPVKKDLVPVGPPFDWAVAGEPFFGMPVEASVLEGLERVSEAFQPVSPDVFRALEDVKMFAHNGLHAFLAFLGALRGKSFFYELAGDAEIMGMARRLLLDEIGPALFRKHGAALDRNHYLNYASEILRRITCRGFGDTIARGTRGAMRKLEPWERMVCGLRTVAQQGIRPEIYALGLAAGIMVAQMQQETELSFDEVLTRHCGLRQSDEADLIALAREKREALERQFDSPSAR